MAGRNKSSDEQIKIVGARQHNLKNITVEIPKKKFTVITGLSGSGKSSLAFDTLYLEGQRRYVESLSTYARQFFGSLQRPDVDYIDGLAPAISIDQKTASSNPRSTVGTMTEIYDYLRLLFARVGQPHCPVCNKVLMKYSEDEIVSKLKKQLTSRSKYPKLLAVKVNNIEELPAKYNQFLHDKKEYTRAQIKKLDTKKPVYAVIAKIDQKLEKDEIERLVNRARGVGRIINCDGQTYSTEYFCPSSHFQLAELSPKIFSFNSPFGACPKCHGLGIRKVIDPKKLIPSSKLTLAQGAIHPWGRKMAGTSGLLNQLIDLKIPIDKPYSKLSKKQKELVLYGDPNNGYEGAIPNLERRYLETDSDHIRKQIENYMIERVCDSCQGKRLKKSSLAVLINKTSIGDLTQLSLDDLKSFFDKLKLPKEDQELTSKMIEEINKRIEFLVKVGVDYLTIDRSANTLAGGEAQRVRLATQLGSTLSGVIYVLDEPTIGLHPHDIDPLIKILKELVKGNSTVVVVEHDQEVIEQSDYVIDVGPGAGVKGGKIIAAGTPGQVKRQTRKSLTAKYLAGKKEIAVPNNRRRGKSKSIEIVGAKQFNLKNIDVKIPLGKLVCITGVSGCGKSTLVYEILGKALSKHFYRSQSQPGEHKRINGINHLDKVIKINQSPIGRTPRSNPATYVGVFNLIRKEFSKTAEAKSQGYDASQFSFNVRKGRCSKCAGQGFNKIEMYFLDDVYITCPKCQGQRYNQPTLEIKYRQKSIAQVLEMSVDEAREFFLNVPKIRRKLEVMQDVGLGYLELGQPATTLSGGEAQRVKLAKELARKSLDQTLYILDEPTTGLHFDDISRLLKILEKLVDRGNTVLVIEHNLDVLKTADWIIDLGPGGGEEGGRLVAQGTPEKVSQVKKSLTGKYLKKVL